MIGFISQTFPPKPRWTTKDIPDLTGKIVIVTGANTGIGKETAKELLCHGAKVYIAVRSQSKAEGAIAELRSITGREAVFLPLDLSDLASVKRAAETFLAQETALHILIASAGVMTPPIDQLTSQGYDLQFGTNVLGHWFFIKLLLPLILPIRGARVVVVASGAADLAPKVRWETFVDSPARRKLGTQRLYAQSKLFSIVLTREFARRFSESGVIFSSLNPGNIRSDLQRNLSPAQNMIVQRILYPVSMGALTSLYAATAPEATANAAYYIPWARVGKTPKKALEDDLGPKFWDWAEKQVQTF